MARHKFPTYVQVSSTDITAAEEERMTSLNMTEEYVVEVSFILRIKFLFQITYSQRYCRHSVVHYRRNMHI